MSVLEEGARGKPGVAGLGAWLARIAPARARGEVTVAIVPDATVRKLNKRFRRIDKATDVLSFPAAPEPTARSSGARTRAQAQRTKVQGPRPEDPAPGTKAHGPRPKDLGDIVIARGVAARQARALGHPFRTELRILALHGLLHLLGYDHEVDDGRMARAEARLRRLGGLPSGLIARTP